MVPQVNGLLMSLFEEYSSPISTSKIPSTSKAQETSEDLGGSLIAPRIKPSRKLNRMFLLYLFLQLFQRVHLALVAKYLVHFVVL